MSDLRRWVRPGLDTGAFRFSEALRRASGARERLAQGLDRIRDRHPDAEPSDVETVLEALDARLRALGVRHG